MTVGKPVRGSTGGTPKYGTQGGYPQSRPLDRSSFSGGVAEAMFGLFLWWVDWREQRRRLADASR